MKFALLTLLLAMVAFASSTAATTVAEADPTVESDPIATGGGVRGVGRGHHGGGGGHHGGGHH